MGTDSDSDADPAPGNTTSPTALAVIEEQADATIRRQIHDGWMFFSVIDVIAVLTDSTYPNRYWSDLKRKLLAEGATQPYEKIVRLKLTAPDGRQRLTDAADAETLLRIIQSVPSPKAEPVKQWLARVGATELQRADEASRPLDPAEASTALAALPEPPPGAPALEFARYYRALADLYQRVADYQQRLVTVDAQLAEHDAKIAELEDRVESTEALTRQVLPDILERLAELGPQTLTPEHQATVKAMVGRLHDVAGYSFAAIYGDLNAAFHVGKYSDIPDAQWPRIAEWLQHRIDAASRHR